MEKLAYSVEEAAEAAGVGRTTLYDLIRTGAIETVKVGRRRIVPVDALRTWLDERRKTGDAA